MNTGLDMFMNIQGKQNIPFRPDDQVLDAANNMAASKAKNNITSKKKKAIAKAVPKGGPSNPSGMDLAKKNISEGIQSAGQKGLEESGGGGGSTADLAGSALMASGNPYAMAGGVALKAISGIAERKRQRAQQEADLENQRRVNIQNALSKLGSGVGTMGMA